MKLIKCVDCGRLHVTKECACKAERENLLADTDFPFKYRWLMLELEYYVQKAERS